MRPTQLLLALLLMPWLCTTGVAAASKAKPAPLPALSRAEQMCQVHGQFWAMVGQARDRGVPLTRTLQHVRGFVQEVPDGLPRYDQLAIQVYASPSVTPAQLRTAVEVGCLEKRHALAPAPRQW